MEDEADGHGIYNDNSGNRYMTMINEDKDETTKKKESGYFLKGKLFGKGEIKYRNGNTYQGWLKGSLRHGFGKMVYETGVIIDGFYEIGEYVGEWKRDKRHGKGTMFSNGAKFIGVYKHDKKFEGEFIDIDGTVYEGRFKNNQFHGEGKITFSSGKSIVGTFHNGELPERGKIYYTNGDVFEGLIFEENPGKEGVMKYANGDEYRGEFVDGYRHGFGVFLFDNGSKYEGKWQLGKRFGKGKEYILERNEYYEGIFINDKRQDKNIPKADFDQIIKNFMKTKSVREPEVKIML